MLIRKYISKMSGSDLLRLASEAEAWELDGVLPDDALVRSVIPEALEREADDVAPYFISYATTVFSETWRELYIRRVTGTY